MNARLYANRTRIVSGLGSVALLEAEVQRLGVGRVAVVADEGVAAAGVLDLALEGLGGTRPALTRLSPVDPGIATAERFAAEARESGCDAVVAVGGGSALGLGKAIALLLSNGGGLHEYVGLDRAPRGPAPCVAVPTTAGSGSEVSPTLVLHDASLPKIVAIRGTGYEPATAVLDGELLRSLPRGPMVEAGLDALSHALESLWARGASRLSDALALAAAREISTLLPRALQSRADDDLQGLLEASTMANLACAAAGLALVHALTASSRPALAHGRMTAVLLPHVARFNAEELGAEALGLARGLPRLYEEIGADMAFRSGEYPGEWAQEVAEVAAADPFAANNRRPASVEDALALLAAAGVDP